MSLYVTHLLRRSRTPVSEHRRLRWNSTGHLIHSSLNEATEAVKRPTRGGQNLTLRYARLERSLRGKEGFQKELDKLTWASEVQTHPPAPANPSKGGIPMFRGFFVPEKPRPPEADECCMSGCAVCVYDLYEESLSAYNESIAALRSSLEERGISETEWPAPVRRTGTPVPTKNNVALSAFEEFEQALKAKKRAPPQKSKKGRLVDLLDVKSLYEGICWLIFSNR
ncbi:Oxidoreductase-like domain-containing protein [Pleurotus pulmonarius]